MTDRTLPPLPTPGVPNTRLPLDRAWKDGSFAADQMQSYALTALAPLEAENADLKAENASLYRLLADIRAAVGDNGKRMQEELVEWLREVAANHRRYGFVRQHWGRICESYVDDGPTITRIRIVPDEEGGAWDVDAESLDRAIDAALRASATDHSAAANKMGGANCAGGGGR